MKPPEISKPNETPNPKAPLPAPTEHVKDRKSLAIALIVSAIFLLAAAGILIWLLTKNPNTTQTAQLPTSDPAKSVKSFTFEAPTTLPAQYVKRDQNTNDAMATYYVDADTSCGVTTGALKLNAANTTPKDAVLRSLQALEDTGVKAKASADGPKVSIADADGKVTYDFSTITLDQDVNMPGVNFKTQSNIIAYKQMGQEVATIGYSCKAEVWEAKKPELEALAKTFTIKTVR